MNWTQKDWIGLLLMAIGAAVAGTLGGYIFRFGVTRRFRSH